MLGTLIARLFRWQRRWHHDDAKMRRRLPDGSWQYREPTKVEAVEFFDVAAW